jgi:argininosuccinate lyase
LPLTYNKDLQEDKEPLFDAVDTLELTLSVAREMVRTLTFNRDRLAAAASDEFLGATDVADLLVRRGVPFRESHGMVAGLVRRALERGGRLSDLTDADVAELAPALDGTGLDEILADGAWLESKVSEGGTSLERVREQLGRAHGVLREAAR